MSDHDQYRYMAQQPKPPQNQQPLNRSWNNNDDTMYSYSDDSVGSYSGQQQLMFDERGEHGEHAISSDYGAAEYYAGGEKLQPLPPYQQPLPRRGRRHWLWFLVVPLLLFAMMGGISGLYGVSHNLDQRAWPVMGKHDGGQMGWGNNNGDTAVHPFKIVSATPRLTINASSASVHIHADQNNPGNVIIVTVSAGSDESAKDVPVSYDSQSGVLTVTDPQNIQGSYDVDISVPNNVNVQVDDRVGDVELDDIHGQINVQDLSGSIRGDAISGQVQLTTQDGSIDLTNTSLSGNSTVQSQNGSITFDGTLDSQGSYDFESTNGSVTLTLPSDASFQLNTPGSSNVNNDFNSTTVGTGPHAQLKVVSQNGDVNIHQNS